ncbi:putative tail sheath protein [Rhizobium phage RHph_Y68]|uniref:Putative tail sheath protein n=1 Tax=Rhizobium phage RHph_Y68 TaxID=2509787 RepID=A0A7S5QY40_9CAUD|nr:tail sheath [Rhizobium phage RHph_Y68]QIG67987.1 putative tail sheath protein [Rhizobium phage RHph_Y68]
MSLYQSPGVYPREIDATLVAAAGFTRSGGFAGNFSWGPVDESVTITDEDNLKEMFWKPNDLNYKDWFLANEFLSESAALRISRVIGSGAKNAIIGGIGSGLTVDFNAINGEVTSVAVNELGTGYTIGDVVEIDTGTINAEIRVSSVDSSGGVTGLTLLSNGTGYVTSSDVETISRKDFLVKNDYDFEDGSTELPPVIAKYPGSLGNSVGASILRASEFFGSFYQDRFIVPPAADMAVFDNDQIVNGVTSVNYTLPSTFVGRKDAVVTFGGAEIAEGSTAGKWSVTRGGDGAITSTVLTLHTDLETFNAPVQVTDTYQLVNASSLDLFSAIVFADNVRLTSRFNSTDLLPKGFFDIDPETKIISVGSSFARVSGDGVSKQFIINTADTVAVTDFVVYAGKTKFNSAATANIGTMKVGITAVTGGYRVTFPDEFTPIVGDKNIVVKWNFDKNLKVHLGVPNASIPLRAFTNQTEVHAVVFDSTGIITGEKDSVIETYRFLSATDPDARKEDGTSNYYVRAINEQSKFIRIPKALTQFGEWKLSQGSDGSAPTAQQYVSAFEIFRNKEDYEVTYLIDPVVDLNTTITLQDIAESRGDCVAFIGYPMSATVNNKGFERRDVLAYDAQLISSSYIHKNPTWIYIFDRYNGKNRWIPATGTDAGMYAKTHTEINMWNVAAGYNRGYYRRALKASWLPKEKERDELCANKINVVIREKGVGVLLLSALTGLRKESLFEDMNVRYLSIYVKKLAVDVLKFILQEINDNVTRAQVRNALNPLLALVKSGRGLYEYKVKCDDKNNTAEVIRQKIMKVDMYLRPSVLVNGIDLRMIYTPVGVSFEEVSPE